MSAATNYGEFMAEAERADPARFAEVCKRHPVKSRRQLDYIKSIELTGLSFDLPLRSPRAQVDHDWDGKSDEDDY